MAGEIDPDELELLRQRALERLKADQLAEPTNPNGTLGMRLATGGMDALSRMSNNNLAVSEAMLGKKIPSAAAPTDNQARYLAEMKSRASTARQKALDDGGAISSIQKLIDAKAERDAKREKLAADMFEKGVQKGPDGTLSNIPGGMQEMKIRAQKAAGDKSASWADVMLSNQNIRKDNLDLRKDEQAARAGDRFEKDKIILNANQQINRVAMGRHTLDSAPIITPELFNEIQADINAAIAQGGSHAASLEHQRQFNSYAIDFAKFKERITNRPQDISSPEVRKYLSDVMSRLEGAYKQNIASRAKQLSTGLAYRGNPAAQEAVKSKLEQYAAPESAGGGGVKMRAPDGSVRLVPAEQVEAAKAAGGVLL